jgi:hypothetical protein
VLYDNFQHESAEVFLDYGRGCSGAFNTGGGECGRDIAAFADAIGVPVGAYQ